MRMIEAVQQSIWVAGLKLQRDGFLIRTTLAPIVNNTEIEDLWYAIYTKFRVIKLKMC